MEKSIDFYVNGLGLERAFTISVNGKPAIEFIRVADYQFIELFYKKTDREYSNENNSFMHISIDVEDCIKYAKEIEDRGYTLMSQPQMGIDGNYQFWIADPDGHKFEIIQIDSNSPHHANAEVNEYKNYDYTM